jgi:Uncharacterized conserved protein
MGARVSGPIEQGNFLRNLGIEKRAATLESLASPEKRAEIDSAVKRLLGEGRTEMGKLFKALGIAHPSIGNCRASSPRHFSNQELHAASASHCPSFPASATDSSRAWAACRRVSTKA